jgi:cytochrome c peroxidase
MTLTSVHLTAQAAGVRRNQQAAGVRRNHDGRAASLADVVDSYARAGCLITDGPRAGDGAGRPLRRPLVHAFELIAEDRADLVVFRGALTDDDLVTDPALTDPWD